MKDTLAIETIGLSKAFGDKVAVSDLTLQVEPGQVFGFLGPNGAGKTTSVKMLLNLVAPDSGHASIFGMPAISPEARRRIGFLPEHFRFQEWMRGEDFLRLHADLFSIPAEVSRKRIAELLDLVGLTDHSRKKLSKYSKGMLQRIGLAKALINKPDLVILDEPTSGLDPVGRRLVRDIIRDLKDKGTSVFLNSHFLSEVEITYNRVAFIKNGKVIKTSSMEDLVKGRMVVVIKADNFSRPVLDGLKPWSSEVALEGQTLRIAVSDGAAIPLINRYLVENDIDVYSIRQEQLSLEDQFLQVVGTDDSL